MLFAKTFPDQNMDLAANDIAREFAEERIRETVTDPAVARDLIHRGAHRSGFLSLRRTGFRHRVRRHDRCADPH